MQYLHNDREIFTEAINQAVALTGFNPAIVEKDYYVTIILRELADKLPFVVFKGGSSLSKCYKVIDRYSEDIDITIDTALSQGQKRKLKEALKDITMQMGLEIPNIDDTRSRRDFNKYLIHYEPVFLDPNSVINTDVQLETSFTEISFPVVNMEVHSFIGDMLASEAPDLLEQYSLAPFKMKVQSIDRTMIDKVFAICDYYMGKKEIDKHSRHIYDIYKLLPLVPDNDEYRKLIKDVRKERAKAKICLSAQPGVNVQKLLQEIVDNKIYKYGYDNLTYYLLKDKISYEEAVSAVIKIIESKAF